MKPIEKLATTTTPDGGEMVLSLHDDDFSISVNCRELMNSRRHESELELARLGCSHLSGKSEPKVLIGGLGMGYTLRQTLDLLPENGKVVVGELIEAVIDWNKEYLGGLTNQPLDDPRTEIKCRDIYGLMADSPKTFDTILLDVDNGPDAMTDSQNHRLYSRSGIYNCRRALRDNGCLAVWSAETSKSFERLLMGCGFEVSRFRVPAYKGSKSNTHFVWIATVDKSKIPPGGGEPRPLKKRKSRGGRKPPRN
jgi:spermidine synthase